MGGGSARISPGVTGTHPNIHNTVTAGNLSPSWGPQCDPQSRVLIRVVRMGDGGIKSRAHGRTRDSRRAGGRPRPASVPMGSAWASSQSAGLCSASSFSPDWISFNCCHFTHSPWGPRMPSHLSTRQAPRAHKNKFSLNLATCGERQPLIIEPDVCPEPLRAHLLGCGEAAAVSIDQSRGEKKERENRERKEMDSVLFLLIHYPAVLVSNNFEAISVNIESNSTHIANENLASWKIRPLLL